MAVTIADLISAIKDTLSTAESLEAAFDFDETPEGIPDTPAMMVYWQDSDRVSRNSDTAGAAFGAPNMTRETLLTFHVDILAVQRSFLGENMEDVITLTDEVWDILDAQTQKPYFGNAHIQAFQWRATRFDQEYASKLYMGTRFIIETEIF